MAVFKLMKQDRQVGRGTAVRALAVLAFAGGLAACANTGELSETSNNIANWRQDVGPLLTRVWPAARSRDMFGAYLAGSHAGNHHDFKSAGDLFEDALTRHPENTAILSRAFLNAIAAGERREAEVLAERLVEQANSAGVSRLVLAIRSLRDGYPERILQPAENEGDEAEDVGLGILLEPIVVAWAHAGLGDMEAAQEALNELGDEGAFGFFRDYNTALIAVMLEDNEAAEEAFAKALPRGGLAMRNIVSYGRFLAASGKRGDAVTVFDAYLERTPHHPVIMRERDALLAGQTLPPLIATPSQGLAEALFGTASALINDRAERPALLYLRLALFAQPDFPAAQLVLADVYERQGNLKSALDVYESVNARTPLKLTAELRAASVLDQMGRTDEALARMRRLERKNSDDELLVQDIVVSRADLLRSNERWRQAAKVYSTVIDAQEDIEAQHWQLFYARGICYERVGNWEAAENDLQKALELQPGQPSVQNYLGYSWVDQGINLEQGRALIEDAVSKRPLDGHIVDSLGWVLYRLGDYEMAARVLERAVVLMPGDPVITDHYGDALWKAGYKREARFQWRQALTLKPANEHAETLALKIDRGLEAAADRPPAS